LSLWLAELAAHSLRENDFLFRHCRA